MASPAAAEAILLLAVAFLLPLRLSTSPSAAPSRRARSATALLTIAALLTAIYAVSDAESRPAADALRSEIDELRLKVARLESMLEENVQTLKSKANILEEDNKLIEALECDFQLLMNGQDSIKKSQSKSYPESNIKAMEEEIEDRIAEQWIQIRQFEQAFVLTKMMTSKVHERSRSSETVYRWPRKDIVLKVQLFLQDAMRSNIYSRRLANERITFCLAYFVVISPVWIAWFLYSMLFGSKK